MNSSNKYWPLSSRANQILKTSGSDNSGENTYTYNEKGYRGDSVKHDIDLITIGCSHTEGIGVNDNETWSYYTAEKLRLKHMNMGFTGRSNDYIARSTNLAIQNYSPRIIAVMYTYISRRELTTKFGQQPYAANAWGYMEDYPEDHKALTQLSTPENDRNNWYKNHALITSLCKANNVKLVWNGTFADEGDFYLPEENRYDGEYRIKPGTHATAEQNRKYSDGLVGYLIDNSYI